MTGHKATPITFVITFLLAVIVWKMSVLDAFKSSLECVPNTLRPIILVIMATVFTYSLSLHTKNINAIKA
ncbi:MAG: hypothetical protein E7211_03510 [Clostridium lundense]|nr:hypothetical protein [Clostridium lundense]